jgi:DNA-binding NarL/FixJ family response regulator
MSTEELTGKVMENLRALVLDPNTCLKKSNRKQIRNITLCPAASAEELSASVVAGAGDFVMVDMELPQGKNGLVLIAELRKKKPDIPAIVLSKKAPTEQDWMTASLAPFLQLVHTPVTDSELVYYVTRLFPHTKQLGRPELQVQAVEKLHNNQGRLDANLIAKLFDLSMTDIAANAGVSRQALAKTPDSLSVQNSLFQFERLACSLLMITGSERGLKIWLNSPNKRFDQHTPLEIIKLGKVAMLADWVDDARLGSPE